MYSHSSPAAAAAAAAAAAGSQARSSPREGPFPPPPPTASSLSSPRRRSHVLQPPPLTTSISPASLAYLPTPLSTTSLSSPFSQHNPAFHPTTPVGASRDTSPMAMRQSFGVSVQYNPQEWTPSTSGTSQGERNATFGQTRPVQYTQADGDPIACPPPPYSPGPAPGQPASRITLGSNLPLSDGNVDTSQRTTPTSSAFAINAAGPSTNRLNRPRPASVFLAHESHFALPPPPPGPPSRGTSASRVETRALGSSILPLVQARSGLGDTTLQEQTNPQAFSSSPGPVQLPVPAPPASRRAASASVTTASTSSSRAASNDGSRSPSRKSNWEPGMPLPGPPSCPPPSASRSQSASGVGNPAQRNMLASASRPKPRQQSQLSSTLGPIPPTPAGWVDEDPKNAPNHYPADLRINTTDLTGPRIVTSPEQVDHVMPSGSNTSVNSGLYRSSAVRDYAAKGIRERRSSNRTTRNTATGEFSALSISTNPWAEAMSATEQDPDFEQFSREADHPSSSSASMVDGSAKPTIGSTASEGSNDNVTSSHSTPLASAVPSHLQNGNSNQTPPFSPTANSAIPGMRPVVASIRPRALPTPPLHIKTQSPVATRPMSQILHLSNDMASTSATPLSPQILSPLASTNTTEPDYVDEKAFMTEAVRRHEEFLRKEFAASNDEERLRLFADYILTESRIRRRKYSKAFVSGKFDVRPIKEKLFEQTPQLPRRSSGLSEVVSVSPTHPTPPSSSGERPDNTWWHSYQPGLSPIVSMSAHDEMSSRGRTPSRWWESQTGSRNGGGTEQVQRSKRESKYMGVPRETREAMQQGLQDPDTPRRDLPDANTGPVQNDYPSEKANPESFGFYNDEEPSTLPQQREKQPESPNTLDISRFVTLPPPYPRHYPAVSNAHPTLVEYRTAVRNMSDLSEVAERKARCKANIVALRKDAQQKLAENRKTFRSNIHAQIEEGSITFAEAAEAEQAFKEEEHRLEKQFVQSEFDCFQDVVLNPLHDMLNGRISQFSILIDKLQHKLQSDAQTINPNRELEAGDEEPELLEKLTQLKWLFEAREQIHREVFDLLTQRNNKYKEVVLLPYRQSNNEQKSQHTEAFFARDNQDRQKLFEDESLARYQDFLRVVDANVDLGVDLQSSAFWDIAPSLCDLLGKIPERRDEFSGIRIPETEFEENQQYHKYPFQYLHSVLQHAEQSTYQFIESQINLHCLLHEVRNGVLTARCKAIAADRVKQGQDVRDAVDQDLKAREEAALTADLKQKVSLTEQQWFEALGAQLVATKDRVKQWLIEEGGWEEEEDIQE